MLEFFFFSKDEGRYFRADQIYRLLRVLRKRNNYRQEWEGRRSKPRRKRTGNCEIASFFPITRARYINERATSLPNFSLDTREVVYTRLCIHGPRETSGRVGGWIHCSSTRLYNYNSRLILSATSSTSPDGWRVLIRLASFDPAFSLFFFRRKAK